MSQVGSKAGSGSPGPAPHSPGPGTFDDVAGFRIGRGGRDNRPPQARPQQQPRQQPYGQQPPQGGPSYGYPSAPQQQPYAGGQPSYGGPGNAGGRAWPPQANAGGGYGGPGVPGGGHGEPEYFGDDGRGHSPGPGPGPRQGHPNAPVDPYAANNPGHTQAFSTGDDPYNQGDTYRAGAAAAPAGPRLRWKELLRGIVTAPDRTFLQMRDYQVWAPAIVVTFVYGLIAVFGFDDTRETTINATLNNAIPIVLTTAVAMVLSAFVLGVVTHTLARQLGGDGAWQPTVGLSMLVMSITDAPRLLVAMFAGGDAPLVQILGWATWIAAGVLLTIMVRRSHDLPWPKALGASAIQLVALLSIVKLGTF
ncbi:membrane protein [Streptomyces sp. NRRL WC-3618]|uniref:Yip1 family protein n=1 Tax=Streptomyces sp. NRRL WC-3618 TaxID=1519490 RepID=UPI0006ADA1D4|nr:Yip1 family protein [Streptomyces sp. NRRL WC-3618]KOV61225.1 membrane protein [Streptomyces sp. NRRL WC-3618]